jgi:hypothetical protein
MIKCPAQYVCDAQCAERGKQIVLVCCCSLLVNAPAWNVNVIVKYTAKRK